MVFLNTAFTLNSQLAEYLTKMLPQLSVRRFAAALRNENRPS
jgi:hypothetical protein